MPNSRGNTYSRGHRYYKSTQRGYWDNAMDELALMDRPAQIDFILNTTGAASLAAVGHSQGCTLTLMLLAMRPEYIDKIWLLMLMGPVTHSEYIQTPYLRAQAKTDSAQVGALRAAAAGGVPPPRPCAPTDSPPHPHPPPPPRPPCHPDHARRHGQRPVHPQPRHVRADHGLCRSQDHALLL
jgi:pimeloyl-ACP methyl ester carboxylesterase